ESERVNRLGQECRTSRLLNLKLADCKARKEAILTHMSFAEDELAAVMRRGEELKTAEDRFFAERGKLAAEEMQAFASIQTLQEELCKSLHELECVSSNVGEAAYNRLHFRKLQAESMKHVQHCR
ncbi:unnamed protein product, partial [Chrysoparadoxa australica]